MYLYEITAVDRKPGFRRIVKLRPGKKDIYVEEISILSAKTHPNAFESDMFPFKDSILIYIA